MRKFTLLIIFLSSVFVALSQQGTINEDEREFLLNNLEMTTSIFKESIENISNEEWTKKPVNGGWTIAECFEHIILAMPRQIDGVRKSLESKVDDSKDLKRRDGFLLSKITDRGVKVKTPLEPQNGNLSKAEILRSYDEYSAEFLSILNDNKAQLRNHFGKSLYGEVDTYQLMIFIPGHVMRHLNQVQEILSTHQH